MEVEKASINLLLLVTGSVAAVKVGLLVDQLFGESFNIRIAATKAAFHFLARAQRTTCEFPLNRILTDDDEWREWQGMNDAVMHIELRRWADLVVVVPLDANSLAKLSNGLCDNLVTCVMRAWEVRQKPVILCPAMNTAMWTHPVTKTQLHTLRDWYSGSPTPTSNTHTTSTPIAAGDNVHVNNSDAHVTLCASMGDDFEVPPHFPATFDEALFQIVDPTRKRLACGDFGMGGMASVENIAGVIRHTADIIRAKQASAAEKDKPQEQEKPLGLPESENVISK